VIPSLLSKTAAIDSSRYCCADIAAVRSSITAIATKVKTRLPNGDFMALFSWMKDHQHGQEEDAIPT
jgi:hypothetical protein